MPDQKRHQFVYLNDRINRVGFDFSNPSSTPLSTLSIAFFNTPTEIRNNFQSVQETPCGLEIPLTPDNVRMMREMNGSGWGNWFQKDTKRLLLEEMLRARSQLAKLLNHQSFAHFYLQDKMVKTPGTF
jgi:hypothetical protein